MPKAYKVKINKEKLIEDLGVVELQELADLLISKYRSIQPELEGNYGDHFKKEKIINTVLRKIEEDDSWDKTDTYDLLIEFLQKNLQENLADYLEKSPDQDPVVSSCFAFARNIRLNDVLLLKILVTISGNWKNVLKLLGIDDEGYEKELAFKMWFNSKGYKKDGLLTLLEKLHSPLKDCFVDWKLMESHLKNASNEM